jgi:hypothetical protein
MGKYRSNQWPHFGNIFINQVLLLNTLATAQDEVPYASVNPATPLPNRMIVASRGLLPVMVITIPFLSSVLIHLTQVHYPITGLELQMSDPWIQQVSQRLRQAGKTAEADLIFNNLSLIQKYVITVNKGTGDINVLKLGSY